MNPNDFANFYKNGICPHSNPNDSELIKQMLDNTILDWNRPSQLTYIDRDANYNVLIPAIEALFATQRNNLLAEILDEIFNTLVAKLPIVATEIGWEAIGEDISEAAQAIALELNKAKVEAYQMAILGICPECQQEVKNWKPASGVFAPEWYETMREQHINPSTGHKTSCSLQKEVKG